MRACRKHRPLDALAAWPVRTAAGAVVVPTGVAEAVGPPAGRPASPRSRSRCGDRRLVAVEEGALDLGAAAGPPGATVRHLLAHASGCRSRARTPVAPPAAGGSTPTPASTCWATSLAAAGMSAADYLAESVLAPLGMGSTELRGSVAKDAWSTVEDLARFARELLAPTLVAPETLLEAVTEQFRTGGGGARPRQLRPQPLGPRVRAEGRQVPALDGAPSGSPPDLRALRRGGHVPLGRPRRRVACVVLTDREFDDWAPPLWSALSADVLAARGIRRAKPA